MIFVLPLFVVGGFVLLAVWWLFFRAAVRHESALRSAKEREAHFDRLLTTPGEPLYCLDCRAAFPGPLGDHGCPQCHTRAFVIPARAHADPSVAAAAPGGTAEAQATAPISAAPFETGEAQQEQTEQQSQRK